jgi:hypothetical protein
MKPMTRKRNLILGCTIVLIGCVGSASARADDTPTKRKANSVQPARGEAHAATPSQSQPAQSQPSPSQAPGKTSTPPGKSEGLRNEDGDTDLAVGETETTSAAPATDAQGRPDVIESRPEKRRKIDEQRLAIAPIFGYGSRDLNIGIGARAGYTFRDLPIYIGGNFVYHFGDTVSVPTGGEASTRFYYPSAEVGYDLGVGPMLVRPYVGVGALLGSGSTSGGAPASSIPRSTETAALVYPAMTLHYLIPDTAGFVGADGRFLIPTQGSAAVAAFLTGGLNL